MMYRLGRTHRNLDPRPRTNLRIRKNIKFKHSKDNLKGIDKSPILRGIGLWDQVPQPIQRPYQSKIQNGNKACAVELIIHGLQITLNPIWLYDQKGRTQSLTSSILY